MNKFIASVLFVFVLVGCGGGSFSCPDTVEHDNDAQQTTDAIPSGDAQPVTDAATEVADVVVSEASVGTTALIVTFRPERGILHPDASIWKRVGTLSLDSYGGDSVFRGANVSGANIGLLDSVTLARAGVVVGEITPTVGACSCGSVRLLEPVTVRDSERAEYEIWGRVSESTSARGVLTFGINGSEVNAGSVNGRAFSLVVSSGESVFHVWRSSPIITHLALPTMHLSNGVEQDLYRLRANPSTTSPVYIGSLTFRFGGGSDGSVSGLHVRVGTTDLARSDYRVYRSNTGELLDGTSVLNSFSEQFTIVFAVVDGYPIYGSGQNITLVGTPSGFVAGSELRVFFGDRIFSGNGGLWGNVTPEGQLIHSDGRAAYPLVDPIVWSAGGSPGGIFTGAWEITDLNQQEVLTVP